MSHAGIGVGPPERSALGEGWNSKKEESFNGTISMQKGWWEGMQWKNGQESVHEHLVLKSLGIFLEAMGAFEVFEPGSCMSQFIILEKSPWLQCRKGIPWDE